jgi:uncharacterized membrane protein
MNPYLIEWLSLLGRWLHLVAGIAWIGASFYFIWLDNHLVPLAAGPGRSAGASPGAGADEGIAGELWAVHGGGFYNSRKYRVAPPVLPPTLHWFYWEAYTTFLSGFFLMCLLYYGQAQIYLIDPAVAALSKPAAIVIGIAFLAGGWVIYDGLCRSPLGKKSGLLGAILAVLLAVAAWGLCNLFSGRGAYIEFGALLGTIMAANVFFVIIPGQRELVRAKEAGRDPDPRHGIAGKLRSTHNTYFTLPVLFVMISNHYAMTFGARYNYLVLIAISAAGACIRVYFVQRHKAASRQGHTSPLPVVLGALTLAGVAFALSPTQTAGPTHHPGPDATPSFARIQSIIAVRCTGCHAANPTQPGFSTPPNGVLLDTPDHILSHVIQMHEQLATRAMPLGNITRMTEDERAQMLSWIQNGSPH